MPHEARHLSSRLHTILFPDPPRDFPLRRAVRGFLRALHILTTGVLLGGHVFDQPPELLMPWLIGSIASGGLLLLTDIHASFTVMLQMRGVLVLLKLIPMILILEFWEARVPLLIVTLAIGAVGSHMPGRMRYWMFVLRDRVAVDRRSG